MSLPKLNVPIYDAELPSGIKVQFRPFLVKEEKLLLIAKQSDDVRDMITTIQQVLQNCIIGTQVEKLSLFDIEFLFLQLVARSIGETHVLRFKCNSNTANGICGKISNYNVNLLDVKPVFGPGHSKVIQLTNDVGLTMSYPSYKTFTTVAREDLPPEEAYDALISCIDSIYDSKGVYYIKDIPETEVKEFIESLTPSQVKKIDDFFDTLPKIETIVNFECPSCGTKEDVLVSGLESFFV